MVDLLIPAIVALPMIGFLITALIGRRLGKQAHIVPVGVDRASSGCSRWSSSSWR